MVPIEIVRYHLDHGADPNRFTGPQGEDNDDDWEHVRLRSRHEYRSPEGSALRAAALGGHEEIICLLLEPRYALSLPRAEYLRTMRAAVRGGHLNIIEIILQNMGASFRELGTFREEMLWEAVRHDQEAMVQMLLVHGTDMNALPYADGRDHGCAIRIAASQGYHHLVRILLDHGSNSNCESQTPIIAAAQDGHEEVVQILLEHGASMEEHSSVL